MKIIMNYGRAVTVLPTLPATLLERATATDLKVLLAAATQGDTEWPSSAVGMATLATRAGCTVAQAEAALAFWRGAGVMDVAEGEEVHASADVTATDLRASTAHMAVRMPRSEPSRADTTEAVQSVKGRAPASATGTAVPPDGSLPTKTEAAADASPRVTVRRSVRDNRLPNYTMDEMNDLLEKDAKMAEYIHECEQVWGKLFNNKETNDLLGLVDYLGLEWDYVITLLAYCDRILKKKGSGKSIQYVVSNALSLYDEGISDLAALQEKLRQMELMADSEGQLRHLFGMGSRALTPKEKKTFSTWLYEYKYGMDVIRMAYDVTVDAKGKPSVNYMNSVLANWNRDGLRTPAEVEAAQKAFRAEKDRERGGREAVGSFDTDDFFEAAVRQSLGENFDPSSIGQVVPSGGK